MKKDQKDYMSSHEFMAVMLESQLSGNHIKLLLAYIRVGGFDPKREVFLTRKDYESYGMIRQTVSRLRQDLIEAGWLVPSGRKSSMDHDYFYVAVGRGVSKQDRGCNNMSQGVSHIESGGVSKRDTEVTTDITTEVSKEVRTKEQAPVAKAPVTTMAFPLASNTVGVVSNDDHLLTSTAVPAHMSLDDHYIEDKGNLNTSTAVPANECTSFSLNEVAGTVRPERAVSPAYITNTEEVKEDKEVEEPKSPSDAPGLNKVAPGIQGT